MKDKTFYQLKDGVGFQQLICFPYLGGYANSFYELSKKISNDIEVWSSNPPGHGASTLKPLHDINDLVNLYYQDLATIIRPNSIFFGHSMGGIVAYFLLQKICHLKPHDFPKPKALVLSACNPPAEFKNKKLSSLSDNDLIKHLQSYQGIADEIINERTLLEYFLPVYRADFMILESSAVCDYEPLDIPVYFLWGEKDQIVPIDAVIKWSNYFYRNINLAPIAGGSHMFINDQVNNVANKIQEIMQKIN